MARYKGKREASRFEKAGAQLGHGPQEERGLTEKAAPVEQGTPAAHQTPPPKAIPVESVGGPVEEEIDPFSAPFGEEDDGVKKKFFKTTAGKTVLVVLCAVLAFALGGAIALGGWIRDAVKPPEVDLPSANTQRQDTTANVPEGLDPPTDEELYPDDGYDGDMPTVSGDRKEGMYTFLLVGTDKDDGNTDTIMVVSYDTVNQDINIMSIPRDTMINESWDIKKINSVYSRTGGSIDALANRVRKLIGFKPDFYVKVDLSMFVQLVDLVGGVDFYVPQDMQYSDPYQDLYIDLKEGQQTLDGDKAMQLVRFRRYAEGDIKRVEVQQSFMKALIKECLSFNNWGKVKAYIELALENVQTDLEFGSVVWFAANVLGINEAPALNMDNVYTCTIPGNYYASTWSRDTSSYQSYVTIYANQTVKLVNERFNPYVQNVTSGMLDIMTIKSNGDIASNTGLKDSKHNAIMAVRRGEAYYDDNGEIVYGQPPQEAEIPSSAVTPNTDIFGNYYIVDEAGNVIYTDANGHPLGVAPPVTPESPSESLSESESGEAGENEISSDTEAPDATAASGETPDPSETEIETELRFPAEFTEPSEPPAEDEGGSEEPDGGTESEIPGWLRPAS